MSDQVYAIGGVRTRRAFLFRLDKVGVVLVSSTLAAALLLQVVVQSPVVLGISAVVIAAMYLALRVPKDPSRRPLLEAAVDRQRARRAARRGWDTFTPSADFPVPRPVGQMLVLGVSKVPGDAEQAIVRQMPLDGGRGGAFFTTTLEIAGRGDGERSVTDAITDAAMMETLLTRMAQRHVPIDEISFTTRAMPGLPRGYRDRMEASIPAHLRGTRLAANARELLNVLAATSDQYRSFVTIAMPDEALIRAIGRNDVASRDRIAQEAHTQLGRTFQYLEAAGFSFDSGLGPRRLGALIRHLYTPSWGIDDTRGIGSTRDGFVPYGPPPYPEVFAVDDTDHDVTWYHSTGHIAPTSWPAQIRGSRWMQPLVSDLLPEDEPSIIRAVTTSYRLVPTVEASARTQDEILIDEAELAASAGKVTDGSSERQSRTGQDRLNDFQDGAAGVMVSVRLTVSAPSLDAISTARDYADEAAARMGIEGGLTWADHRQADAMLWSLPLCRGIPRTPPSRLGRLIGA